MGLLLFGRRWVTSYPLVAAFVPLVLLFAPDSWTAFGPIFDTIAAGVAAKVLVAHARPGQSTVARARFAR